ncbi:helix-turn-helix domain-containing protein [Methylomagnum sp.]
MSLNLNLMGSKIKRYREQLLITIEELSISTGIDGMKLDLVESGKTEPTGDEILILADFFRCDYRFFISNEKLAPFEQTEELYRQFGREFTALDRKNIQDFLFLCECEEFLQTELALKKHTENFSYTKQGAYFKAHGQEAAFLLRKHLDYKDNEVVNNIYEDIREIGAHVFRRKLGNSNISGLYIYHPVAGKCVLINYDEDIYRQRFTAAHELAHAILDIDKDVVVSLTKWTENDLVEIRANTFASHYLIPPETLSVLSPINQLNASFLIDLANRFKVNIEPLLYSLKNNGFLDYHEVKKFQGVCIPRDMKEDSELPKTLSEKSKYRKTSLLEIGLSDYYVNLCFDAYDNGVISRGRLAECLLIKPDELNSISDLYGRSMKHGN